MKYSVQLTTLLLLYLINNQIQLCKSEIHLRNGEATLMQSLLNNFTKYYLHVQTIKNDKHIEIFSNKFGLYNIDMWEFIRKGPLSEQNANKMTFSDNFHETLNYFHNFYQLTSECITNKMYKMEKKKLCTQQIVNETSVYRKKLSTMVKTYILPNDENQSLKLFDVLFDILELRKVSCTCQYQLIN